MLYTLLLMDSLQDLLKGRTPKEPDEVAALKRYIFEEFGAQSSVSIRGETLIITVGSASLANMLRLRLPAMQAVANTSKKLVFRIG